MPRVMGKNKEEIGSVGAASGNEDPFYGNSPSDHQHQYAQNPRLLELLGTFTDVSPYPPCRIFAVGNSVFLHGIISSSGSETDICQIPNEFLPSEEKLPLYLLTPKLGTGSYINLLIDTDKILKTEVADTWTFIEFSMIRYIKE